MSDDTSAHARHQAYQEAELKLRERWKSIGAGEDPTTAERLAGCPEPKSAALEAADLSVAISGDPLHSKHLPDSIHQRCKNLTNDVKAGSATALAASLRDLVDVTTGDYNKFLVDRMIRANLLAARLGDAGAGALCAAASFRTLLANMTYDPQPIGRALVETMVMRLGVAAGVRGGQFAKSNWSYALGSEIAGVRAPAESVTPSGDVQHDHRELALVDDLYLDIEEDAPRVAPVPSHVLIAHGALTKPRKKASDPKPCDEYYDLVGEHLPLHRCEDIARAETIVASYVPWARPQIARILRPLARQKWVHFRPLLLVGPPGCAKSTLATKIAEALGLPSGVFNCAGVADAHFGGLSKGWSSAHTAMPTDLVKRKYVANAAAILDEVDKCGTSRNNGNLSDTLCALLEPENARRYMDPGLGCEVDLSAVNYLATANVLEDVPGPLRDRFTVVRIPMPGPEHLGDIAARIVEDLRIERAEDERMMPDLDPQELVCVLRLWDRPKRSLRTARQVVEAWVDGRSRLGLQN